MTKFLKKDQLSSNWYEIDAKDAVNHQPEYAAATITPGGHKAIYDGAYAMGSTIIDLAEKNLWDNL